MEVQNHARAHFATLRIKENYPELKVEARIEQGSPAKKITELAENEGFDLII